MKNSNAQDAILRDVAGALDIELDGVNYMFKDRVKRLLLQHNKENNRVDGKHIHNLLRLFHTLEVLTREDMEGVYLNAYIPGMLYMENGTGFVTFTGTGITIDGK